MSRSQAMELGLHIANLANLEKGPPQVTGAGFFLLPWRRQ
jgi:hypothetical protein